MKLRFNNIYDEYEAWDDYEERRVTKRYYCVKNLLEYFDEEKQVWVPVPSVENSIVREGKS